MKYIAIVFAAAALMFLNLASQKANREITRLKAHVTSLEDRVFVLEQKK